jgi:hypothetical protein
MFEKLIFLPIVLSGALALSACSGTQSRATCFDCTTTPSSWSNFSFTQLEGTWRGTVDHSNNAVTDKQPQSKSSSVEVAFLDGRKFLKAFKIESCGNFPAEAMVLMNELWWDRASKQPENMRSFEVFGRADKDQVVFGRARITRTKTANTCEFSSNEKPIVMNRLALPAVSLSQRLTNDGRALASGSTDEVDVDLEFLNFEHAKNAERHRFEGKKEREAPLFFRFVKTTRSVPSAFSQGEWRSSEEKIFRLWRVN